MKNKKWKSSCPEYIKANKLGILEWILKILLYIVFYPLGKIFGFWCLFENDYNDGSALDTHSKFFKEK